MFSQKCNALARRVFGALGLRLRQIELPAHPQCPAQRAPDSSKTLRQRESSCRRACRFENAARVRAARRSASRSKKAHRPHGLHGCELPHNPAGSSAVSGRATPRAACGTTTRSLAADSVTRRARVPRKISSVGVHEQHTHCRLRVKAPLLSPSLVRRRPFASLFRVAEAHASGMRCTFLFSGWPSRETERSVCFCRDDLIAHAVA